jgi:hypothetical protein
MRRFWAVWSFAWLVFLFAVPAEVSAQHWSGIIHPSRATNWTTAGVNGGIPNRTQVCATLNPGASVSQINSAISSCPSGQVVFLNAGTYNLSGMVNFGSKSNVTLRGAGANRTLLVFSGGSDCGGLSSVVCIDGDGVSENSPPNSTSWTAGYAPGTTVITVGSSSGMQVGRIIILDQLNDSSDGGGIFVCSTTSCTDEGGNAPGRNNRGQLHLAKVTAISGNQVTISPALRMPNWRSSQSPGIWWNGGAPIITGIGIEDLSLNVGNRDNSGVVFLYASDSWVKGVRVMNPGRNHVWAYKSMRITVRDSYFYGGGGGGPTSYGIEEYASGGNLLENNIFNHVTTPISLNGSSNGSVVAYNFMIDAVFSQSANWMNPPITFHEVGISHMLVEGNDGLGMDHDGIHGTTHFNTLFRNHWYGDVWNNPAKSNNTQIVHIVSYGRFFNIIGNVLGRTGYYTSYDNCSARSVFCLGNSPESGQVPDDPRTPASMIRWGNYDTVNNAVRFQASEVPTGDPFFPNAVPASQALPASFYLSGPPSFWSTPWGTPPWPAIGPDVTGGNISGWGGHANKIPARLCYENTPKSNNVLDFNASACYSSTAVQRPEPPTQLTVLVE